jgi:uncharacterized YkwD family protein
MRTRISAIRRVRVSRLKVRSLGLKRKPVVRIKRRIGIPRAYLRQFVAFEAEVARLVNEERTSRGIAALTVNARLSEIARTKARDMRDDNYFGHNSPTYGTPEQMLNRFGVTFRSYGENIAAGQPTPEAVMRTWMNSSVHRGNILDPNFTDIGVGYVAGTSTSRYQHYWTQLFIQR